MTDTHVSRPANQEPWMIGEEKNKIELAILMPCLNEAETLGICITKAQEYLTRSKVHGEVLVADNGSTDGSVQKKNKIELTILMPCLNEAETLGICITKAQEYLTRSKVHGEVLVADNGSTDGSVQIAKKMGARVVHVPIRGYGSALRHGIDAARGRFVVMGDADDSYDFGSLGDFIAELRDDAPASLIASSLVMLARSERASRFAHCCKSNRSAAEISPPLKSASNSSNNCRDRTLVRARP